MAMAISVSVRHSHKLYIRAFNLHHSGLKNIQAILLGLSQLSLKLHTSSNRQSLKYFVLFKLNVQPMPKRPRPPAMAAVGNIEVAKVAAEKIRAAPPVTIGKTTRVMTIIDYKGKIQKIDEYLLCNYFYILKMV